VSWTIVVSIQIPISDRKNLRIMTTNQMISRKMVKTTMVMMKRMMRRMMTMTKRSLVSTPLPPRDREQLPSRLAQIPSCSGWAALGKLMMKTWTWNSCLETA